MIFYNIQGGEMEGMGENEGEDILGEPEFPHQALSRLDEMIHRQRWVVPVLPKSELEVLLDASINLCSRGKRNFYCRNLLLNYFF